MNVFKSCHCCSNIKSRIVGSTLEEIEPGKYKITFGIIEEYCDRTGKQIEDRYVESCEKWEIMDYEF